MYEIGGGVTAPKLIQSVEPAAMINGERTFLHYAAVSLTVDATGAPGDIEVKKSRVGEPHTETRPGSPAIDQSIIEAVKQYRFKPATCRGEPVAVVLILESNWFLF